MEALKYHLANAWKRCRQYPWATATLTLAMLLGIYVWLQTEPQRQKQTQLAELRTQWERMERNLRNATGLAQQLEEMQDLQQQLKNRLTRREEVALNQSYFYQLEQASGVSIMTLNQQPPFTGQPPRHLPQAADFDIIGFAMTVEGEFSEVLRFIDSVQQGVFPARVENVTLNRGRDQAGRKVSANLQIFILGAKRT